MARRKVTPNQPDPADQAQADDAIRALLAHLRDHLLESATPVENVTMTRTRAPSAHPPTQRAAAEQRTSEHLAPVEPIVLSPQQEIAIMALLAGKRQQEAAEAAGVAPETVSRWLANDVKFVATLNARRREMWDAQRARLCTLVERAIETIEECLTSAPPAIRLRAALAILASADVLSGPTPAALPASPDAVEKQWYNERSAEKLNALDLMTFFP